MTTPKLKKGDCVTIENRVHGATVVRTKSQSALVKYHDPRDGAVKRWFHVDDLEPTKKN